VRYHRSARNDAVLFRCKEIEKTLSDLLRGH
jgi:hypothetical protein